MNRYKNKIAASPILLYSALFSLLAWQQACKNHPAEDKTFFNGHDLTGWSAANPAYWSVQDSAIIGHADTEVAKNEFLWSDVEVSDFYLSIDVKLDSNNRNAGIQFRSKKLNESGQAVGYQADIGKDVWGRLYHEHDRGQIDWPDDGEKAVKTGDWNHYEILVSGNRIWTAINGVLSSAIDDPFAEKKGRIALQIHGGPAQTVRYRIKKLVHYPTVALAGLNENQLTEQLRSPLNLPAGKTAGDPLLRLKSDDLIAFTGGTNMANTRRDGFLETLLIGANKNKKLHFRNLSWEGDTVFDQFRDAGFGGWLAHLDSVSANVLFTQFGQMECLQGDSALERFINSYQQLLDSAKAKGRQVIVLSPIPFELETLKLAGTQQITSVPIATAPVKKYADAIRQMAKSGGFLYVDLYRHMKALPPGRYTSNGIHLTPEGQQTAASIILKELRLPAVYDKQLEPLRQEVINKNEYWFQYWRAGNWAFIYGAENVQPFSRDWKDREHRILPEERNTLHTYIETSEKQIDGFRKKL